MDLYQIQEILEQKKIPFELIRHEKRIHSAQDGAAYFKIPIGQTAPTLIVHSGKGFFAVIFSGERSQIDFSDIEKILECDAVRMATKKEVEQVTGFRIGSLPMFGLPFPCVVDKLLFKYDYVFGGTGQIDLTLKIKPAGLLEMNRVIGMLD